MPAIGLGTFGSDHASAAQVAQAVKYAASVGYRHIDCASVYANEAEIGQAFESCLENGIAREHLWITSKVWNDSHAPQDVIASCRRSLADLRLSYLDLYLVHWPFPNFHPPFCDVESRSPDAQPYSHERFLETWRAMEQLHDAGLVRHIGTSNMTISKLTRLLDDARLPPAVNEMELHPHFQQPDLFGFLQSNGIEPVAYSPIGSPARPARDRTPEDSVDIEDPVIVTIAERLHVHPTVVCLKWSVGRGATPIPFSTNPRNILANLQGVAGEPLTSADMQAISAIDRNCRLIKGQVFLWEGAQSWQELWQ